MPGHACGLRGLGWMHSHSGHTYVFSPWFKEI
jgi:hypothetical protein